MRNRQGRFEFTKTEKFPLDAKPSTGHQICRKTQSLLLEGARRIDENRPDTRKLDRALSRSTASVAENANPMGTVTG